MERLVQDVGAVRWRLQDVDMWLVDSLVVPASLHGSIRRCASQGHRVLSTQDGLEAIELVRRVRIDVLVVGVLPGGRRQTLVGELRSIQPGLRIVSMRDRDDDLQQVDLATRLSSPLSLDDLRGAVAASLNPGE